MRFPKIALAAAVVGVSFSAPAIAQDFNGPFIGVQAGLNSDNLRNPNTAIGRVPMDDNRQSFTGGIYAGYDYQVKDKVVIGAEGSFDVTADDKMRSVSGATSHTIDPRYSFDLTARAGYLVTPDTLVYVRGGYTNARVKASSWNGAVLQSATGNRDGWLVGGGVERKLMTHVSARLEYRYSDLSDGGAKYDRHRVLAGVSYRF